MECGHAFEARLYAENPDNGFAPSIGTLTTLRLPEALARIDSGVREGQEITPFYDPMIAKIITNGGTREEALSRMALALEETRVAGLETNARFLYRLATDEDFAAGKVSTRYIEEHGERLFAHPQTDNRALAAALLHMHLAARAGAGADPWEALTGFRLNKPAKAVYWLMLETGPALARMLKIGERIDVTVEPQAGAAARREGDIDESLKPTTFSFTPHVTPNGYAIELDGATFNALAVRHGDKTRIFIGADHFDIAHVNPLDGVGAHGSAEGSLVAPMPGVITLLQAEPGATVDAGATLLVMEAMKMEHAIKAPHDGVVKAFRFKAGDQVKEGDLLVEFEEG
jgi:3-methylcrotonyl-CoA carboxylase alpha subunit